MSNLFIYLDRPSLNKSQHKMTKKDLETSPAARLHHLIHTLDLINDYGLSEKTGISRNTIKGILNRDTIGGKTAKAIADALDISYKWVRYGEGPIERPKTILEEPNISVNSPIEDPYAYAYIKKAKARLSAGGGVIPEEEFEDQRYAFIRSWLKTVASSESACVLMEIDGDSMRPTLESGDMVLVDQGRQDLISDGIYAFGEGDVINIKRLQRVYPNVRIVSDNPDRELYPSREIEPSSIRIIGRVIWFARQLR